MVSMDRMDPFRVSATQKILDEMKNIDYMFPERWHKVVNFIFLVQTSVAIYFCLKLRLFFPHTFTKDFRYLREKTEGKSRKWENLHMFIRQFKYLLIVHGIFYGLELLFTDMITEFHGMALHHLVSIAVFVIMFMQPEMVSATTLVPYLLHHLYWTLGAVHDEILYVYNLYFFCLGLYFCDKCNLILPTLSILLPTVNYYSFCVFYKGKICYDHSVIVNGVITGTSLLLSGTFCMYRINRRKVFDNEKDRKQKVDILLNKHTVPLQQVLCIEDEFEVYHDKNILRPYQYSDSMVNERRS